MRPSSKLRTSRIVARHAATDADPFKQIARGYYDPVIGWIPWEAPSTVDSFDSLRIFVCPWMGPFPVKSEPTKTA